MKKESVYDYCLCYCAEDAPVNRYTLNYSWDTEIPVYDISDEPIF